MADAHDAGLVGGADVDDAGLSGRLMLMMLVGWLRLMMLAECAADAHDGWL